MAQQQRQWLLRYIQLQKQFDPQLIKILQIAAKDAEKAILKYKDKPGIGAQVRVAQLMGSRGSIHRILSYLWRDIGRVTESGRAAAQAAAIEQSFDWDETLLRRAVLDPDDRESIKRYLLSSADRNVDALLARIFGPMHTLSESVYTNEALTNGWVERAINSALARGATVKELADDVRKLIDPGVKGGVSHAAMRLARTEINNAYHAQSVDSARDKPWVKGVRWRLSNSHPKPDNCNLYATADNGLGKGVWPADRVPGKPHPNCLCYVVPELVSVAEFQQNLKYGMYDVWLDEHSSTEIASSGRQVS
jgi:hypothetical protein